MVHDAAAKDRRAPPVIVSGSHRSGTTWVGKVIATAGNLHYIHEPLNRAIHDPGMLAFTPTCWYPHIESPISPRTARAFGNLFALRYSLWRRALASRSRRDLGIGKNRWKAFRQARLQNARPLIKGPFFLLTLPALAEVFHIAPVISVRHPAAFVSSLLIKDWPAPVRDLIDRRRWFNRNSATKHGWPVNGSRVTKTPSFTRPCCGGFCTR